MFENYIFECTWQCIYLSKHIYFITTDMHAYTKIAPTYTILKTDVNTLSEGERPEMCANAFLCASILVYICDCNAQKWNVLILKDFSFRCDLDDEPQIVFTLKYNHLDFPFHRGQYLFNFLRDWLFSPWS